MQASRVLIVDDREAVRESIQLSLDGFPSIFSEAGTGNAALSLLRTQAFDVTFLAVRLPDILGLDVLDRALSEGLNPGKVIFALSLPDPKAETEALRMGAFRVVEKPLDYERLRTMFGEATSTSAPSIAPLLAASGAAGVPDNAVPIPSTHRRILVLHDQVDWLNHIQEALEHDFELIQTTDDNEACRWANQEHLDLAVIDHRLARGISGLEVLGRMRMAHPLLRGVILIDYPEYKPLLDVRSAIAYFWKRDLRMLAATIHRFLDHPVERRRIFLSYAREDRERVLDIHAELMSQGFLPWIDVKSIIPGKEWEPEIDSAIDAADFFVYCLSRHSVIKEGPIVKELRHALRRQEGLREQSRFIITARLDEVSVDSPLTKFHWVDLFVPDGMSQFLDALSAPQRTQVAPMSASPSFHAPPLEIRFFSGAVKDLIVIGESAELEFKSSLRWDIRQQRTNKDLEGVIVKTVAAFLNMPHGGVLLVGVADDGTILGLEQDYQTLKSKNRDGFERHTYQLLLEAYGSDMAMLVRVGFEGIDGKDICRITAQPSHKPIYVEGRFYIRTGNATRELSARDSIEYTRTRWKA